MNTSWVNETTDKESHSRHLKLVCLPMCMWEQETQGDSNETQSEQMGIQIFSLLPPELDGSILACVFLHGAAICHINIPLSHSVPDIWCYSIWLW